VVTSGISLVRHQGRPGQGRGRCLHWRTSSIMPTIPATR
jgi:hypothetical protein